jgi:hypothetical protein
MFAYNIQMGGQFFSCGICDEHNIYEDYTKECLQCSCIVCNSCLIAKYVDEETQLIECQKCSADYKQKRIVKYCDKLEYESPSQWKSIRRLQKTIIKKITSPTEY